MSTFRARAVSILQKSWMTFLAFIGMGSLLDLLREYGRAKGMDWITDNFPKAGNIGIWAATYSFAFVTAGILCALGWLLWAIVKQADTPVELQILDAKGKPVRVTTLPKAWRNKFTVVSLLIGAFLVYGVYVYYTRIPLLRKYPLGYVIFKDDYVTNAVTPIETKRGLENLSFDFRPVRITQNAKDRIAVRLPDVLVDKQLTLTGIETEGPKRVGELGGGVVGDDKGMVIEWAEITAIKDSQITFLVGFQRGPALPVSLTRPHPQP